MPIIDSTSCDQVSINNLQADICIIGTGPAGSTIARELAETKRRVVILESGGLERQPQVDSLNEIESIGWPRELDNWHFRNRIVGGSSHTWNGRSAPFDEIDFEKRPWVPYSGWPFELQSITPYLDRSASYVGLAVGSEYNGAPFWDAVGRKVPKRFRDPLLVPMFWQFSADDYNRYDYMRFGPQLINRLNRLSRDVTLVTNATVRRINPVISGAAVESVEFVTLDGRKLTLTVPTVVLCAGGIENARLLLCSDNVVSGGLGNSYDTVGRFLMDHLRGQVASFKLTDTNRLMKYFGHFRARGKLFESGIQLSPRVQREEFLLNCAAWIGETVADDDPWYSVVRFLRRKGNGRDALNILLRGDLIARGAYDYFLRRRGLMRKLTRVGLDCMCEQRPDPDSRITLSDRQDRHGVRLPRIDWRVSHDEARCMRRIAELAVEKFPRLGLPAPVLDQWVRDGGMPPESFQDVGHPTGSTRMSDDPRTGVVDANCQVYGVHGLFIAGSSIFPTAGHANPTQMIVAMALRLADHLIQRPIRMPLVRTKAHVE